MDFDTWFYDALRLNYTGLQQGLETHAGQKDSTGSTALMIVAEKGSVDCVKLLAPKEAGHVNTSGKSALFLAAINGHSEVVRILGPMEAHTLSNSGEDALMLAARTGSSVAVPLLSPYIDLAPNKDGLTALELAINNDSAGFVRALLEAKTLPSNTLSNALQHAATRNAKRCINVIRTVLAGRAGQLDITSGGAPSKTALRHPMIPPISSKVPDTQDDDNPVDIMKRLSRTARPLSAGNAYAMRNTVTNPSGTSTDDFNVAREQARQTLLLASQLTNPNLANRSKPSNNVDLPIDVSILRESLAMAQSKIKSLEEQLLMQGVADPRACTNDHFLKIKRLTDTKTKNVQMLTDMQNLLADAKAATRRVEGKLMVAEKLTNEDYASAIEAHNAGEIILRENMASMQRQLAVAEAQSERQKLQLITLHELCQNMSMVLAKLWYQLPLSKNLIDLTELLAKPEYFIDKDGTLSLENDTVSNDELFTLLYEKIHLFSDSLDLVVTDSVPIIKQNTTFCNTEEQFTNMNYYHQQTAGLKAELASARALISEREKAWERERASLKQLKLRLNEIESEKLYLSKEQNEQNLSQRVLQLEAQCARLQMENLSLRQDLVQQVSLMKHVSGPIPADNTTIYTNVEMHARIGELEKEMAHKNTELQEVRELLKAAQARSKANIDKEHTEQEKLLNEIYCLRTMLYGPDEDVGKIVDSVIPGLQNQSLNDPIINKRLVKELSQNIVSLSHALHRESLKRVTVPPDALELQNKILALECEKTELMRNRALLEKELQSCKKDADDAAKVAEMYDKQNFRTIQTLRADYDGLQRRCIELLKQHRNLSAGMRGLPKSAANVLSSLHATMSVTDFSGPSFTTVSLSRALDPAQRDPQQEAITAMGIVEDTSATPFHYSYTVAAVQTEPHCNSESNASFCEVLEKENISLSKKLLELDNELEELRMNSAGLKNVDLDGLSLNDYVEAHKKQERALRDATSKIFTLQQQNKDYNKVVNERDTLEAKCKTLQAEIESLQARIEDHKSSGLLTINSKTHPGTTSEVRQTMMSATPLTTAGLMTPSQMKSSTAASITVDDAEGRSALLQRNNYSNLLSSSSQFGGTALSKSRPNSTKMGATLSDMEHNMLAMAALQTSRNGSRPSSRTNSRPNSRIASHSRPLSGSAFGRTSLQGSTRMDGSTINSATTTSANARMYIRSDSNKRYSSTAFGGPGHISEFCARPERPRSPAAAAANRLHAKEVALELGPNSRTPYSTPLMDAVIRRDLFGVESEMSHAGMQKIDGTTALMLAITCNFPEAIPILLNVEAGMKKDNGDTALSLAIRAEMYDIARLLTPREGLDISGYSKENNRITELMVAAAKNDVYTVWCLRPIQGGLIDPNGRTALMYAAKRGALNCIKMLDDEFGMQDGSGETALMMAASMGLTEVVKVLAPLENSIQTTLRHSSGHKCTALMLAILSKQLHVCQYLAPYEGNVRDENNQSALDYLLASRDLADSELFQRVRIILMQHCR